MRDDVDICEAMKQFGLLMREDGNEAYPRNRLAKHIGS